MHGLVHDRSIDISMDQGQATVKPMNRHAVHFTVHRIVVNEPRYNILIKFTVLQLPTISWPQLSPSIEGNYIHSTINIQCAIAPCHMLHKGCCMKVDNLAPMDGNNPINAAPEQHTVHCVGIS